MASAAAIRTCADLLGAGEARLRAAGIATARLDAEVLLAVVLESGRAALYAGLRAAAPAAVEDRFRAFVERRARHEPVAYITGTQEFWSLALTVNSAVLIPRPETELLVDTVCRLAPKAPRVCDAGTGSGCIAVAVARELPEAQVLAVDCSAAALEVAARNAAAHGVAGRVAFLRSDLFDALDPAARFDIVVSNPPYLTPAEAESPDLAFEPRQALAGGDDGLDVIRRLIAAAPARLVAGGWLLMEMGADRDEAVVLLARSAGFAEIAVERDLAGLPRALVARRVGGGA